MALLLVVFHVARLENGVSGFRIILESALRGRLKQIWIRAELVMRSYLIQCILVTHVLIFGKVNGIFFLSEAL